jgi:hypothetical protein
VRRSLGDDEGFAFDPEGEPWNRWRHAGRELLAGEATRIGAGLDWPGITPPGRVRQDWGRCLDGRPVGEGWVRRGLGGGPHASLAVRGAGPVPPTLYQRLFVWSMAGRYRLRPGPILEIPLGDEVRVYQPVTDTQEVT